MIAPPLRSHPCGGVCVPLVAISGDSASRGEKQGHPIPLFQGCDDRVANEPAPAALSRHGVDSLDEVFIHVYVHSHVLTLAHKPRPTAGQGCRRRRFAPHAALA
jgi:hypothetical protein